MYEFSILDLEAPLTSDQLAEVSLLDGFEVDPEDWNAMFDDEVEWDNE